MTTRTRKILASVLAAMGLIALVTGGSSLGGQPAATTAEAAFRPFDNTLTDQDHHRNDILLPREAPVQITRDEVIAQASGMTTLQILAVNDFHGNLAPPGGSGGRIATADGNVDAGGVTYLSTHIDALRATNPNTIVVSAGDLIGASPFLSALFHDEPTITAWNEIGLKYNAVGNHEFDEGSVELMRLQNGGCHPTDGCQFGQYAGADFTFLGANVIDDTTGKPFLPPYGIETIDGVKVAFVGVVTDTTPTIVSASGVQGLSFIDEAEGVNRVVPELKAQGVEAIVVLVHEGGNVTGLYNECRGLTGPIADIMNALDPEVDVVVSGHSHVGYNCMFTGRVLTQSASAGRLIGKIDLTLDKATGEVASMTADNVIATRTVTEDPALASMMSDLTAAAGSVGARPIGKISGASISRTANSAGESPLGDLIADSQLAASDGADEGGAQIAFMNPGGIRADLLAGADGTVTYESAFTVQPFNNYLVTMTLTGAQIDLLLEQQWIDQNPPRILQVSKGFSYRWDASKPDGQKVDAATIKLNGIALSPTANYRVVVNSFLADGGDKFFVLREGKDRLFGGLDIDGLEDYLTANAPVATPAANRFNVVNLPAPTPTATATEPAATATTPATTATASPTVVAPRPPNTGTGTVMGTEASLSLVLAGVLLLGAAGLVYFRGSRQGQGW